MYAGTMGAGIAEENGGRQSLTMYAGTMGAGIAEENGGRQNLTMYAGNMGAGIAEENGGRQNLTMYAGTMGAEIAEENGGRQNLTFDVMPGQSFLVPQGDFHPHQRRSSQPPQPCPERVHMFNLCRFSLLPGIRQGFPSFKGLVYVGPH
jgi:hypothetical protein